MGDGFGREQEDTGCSPNDSRDGHVQVKPVIPSFGFAGGMGRSSIFVSKRGPNKKGDNEGNEPTDDEKARNDIPKDKGQNKGVEYCRNKSDGGICIKLVILICKYFIIFG